MFRPCNREFTHALKPKNKFGVRRVESVERVSSHGAVHHGAYSPHKFEYRDSSVPACRTRPPPLGATTTYHPLPGVVQREKKRANWARRSTIYVPRWVQYTRGGLGRARRAPPTHAERRAGAWRSGMPVAPHPSPVTAPLYAAHGASARTHTRIRMTHARDTAPPTRPDSTADRTGNTHHSAVKPRATALTHSLDTREVHKVPPGGVKRGYNHTTALVSHPV